MEIRPPCVPLPRLRAEMGEQDATAQDSCPEAFHMPHWLPRQPGSLGEEVTSTLLLGTATYQF